MRAIIEIFLAIIFSYIIGCSSLRLIENIIKKEAIIKVHSGIGSLESFSKRLTSQE
ncbi:MAG: hypothetical protein QF441_15755 [Bacteriovoracaceae bacterium]|jgi:hypothetical protein|nr:hypothetical protein [Bacteriovoracaceae bacterium]